MEYIAHINGDKIQSCTEHCLNTAKYAKTDLMSVGLGNTAYLAGLIHDMGKFTKEFNEYIQKSARGENVRKGSVIHSFAGVRMMMTEFHPMYSGQSKSEWERITAEMIATAVGCHHGLFDEYDENHRSGLKYRIEKQPEYDERAKSAFYELCCKQEDIAKLFLDACKEICTICEPLTKIASTEKELMFYLGLIQRLLNSAVMDGDRKDTAEFMGDFSFSEKTVLSTTKLWHDLTKNVTGRLDAFPQKSEIQKARRKMSDYCAEFARKSDDGEIYRMNLPTGGGKTLSSLRYALEHAKKYGKERIVFVVPLLSILDQNAEVIRENVGNDDIVLEHHSNIVMDGKTKEECTRQDLLAETWESPIIITTLVQFLNTLFSGKTNSVRRFEALTNSVIVFDEVQTVPQKMISLFNLAINFLTKICHATVLLCSATQPSFEENKYSMLISEKRMIPQKAMNHFSALFKRVEVTDKGNMTIEEIRNLAIESCINHRSALIICNTKREARTLYRLIDESDIKCVHLSTSMCMAHRKEEINEMRELLKKKVPFICVSTQLIEAGVDVSFGCVIRFSSGIDSIVQAAGRCNRNGENKISPVYIVHLKGESLKFLNEIEEGKNLTAEVIREFQKNPEKYDNDLISEKAIADFYNRYFRKLNNCIRETEYPVAFGESIFELLSTNAEFLPEKCEFAMWQAYKTAGDQFEVFDDSQRTVVIPYNDEAKRIISELSGSKAKNDIYYCKTQLNLLKQYTVQLFNYEYSKFVELETIRPECEGAVSILDVCCYDKNLGIIVPEEETGMLANEDLFLEV